jgi:hypothetical protein
MPSISSIAFNSLSLEEQGNQYVLEVGDDVMLMKQKG